MLFAFGAIWVYHFRSSEMYQWLWPRPYTAGETQNASLVSPVDAVLSADLDLALLRLEGPPPRIPEREPAEPESQGAGALSVEQELATADLPLEEGASADGGDGAGGRDAGPSGEETLKLQDPPSLTDAENSHEAVGGEGGEAGEAGSGEQGTAEEQGGGQPGGPDVLAYEEFTYKVEKGESLWRIAEKFLGSGSRYRELLELNQEAFRGKNTDRIPEGAEIRIRRPVQKEPLKISAVEADTSVEENSARGTPVRGGRKVTLHTVKRNENLKKIAERYYPGNMEGWRTIYEANRDLLASAGKLTEGQVLRIPVSPASAKYQRKTTDSR